MWDKATLNRFNEKVNATKLGGGEARIAKQHESGKLTARERIELLFDKNTFVEVGAFVEGRITDFDLDKRKVIGDGVITGYGQINGRTVFVSSQDFTVIGGTLGENHSAKICRVMDMAYDMKVPFISINDGGGARIEEGILSLNGYSGIFYRNTKMSGVVPQISVILGPCAGGACYSPAISDFIFMTEKNSKMFITGPQVVKAVTGLSISADELGGADVQSSVSGVVHFVHKTEEETLTAVRNLLDYLPLNNLEKTMLCNDKQKSSCSASKLMDIVPDAQTRAYDVKQVIDALVDKGSFTEIQSNYALNIVIGFARFNGECVGIVANQPNHLSGTLDVNASDKAARFIRFCDCFNIPIVSLVDVTGFLPGKDQEHLGIIRHGAKLLYAYAEATVPKISLILRKAYGGAYIAMNSKGLGADCVFAWPIAQIAVMGSEGAVDIIYKKQIASAEDSASERAKCVEDYNNWFMNPYIAASHGLIDEIILPENSRSRIISALEMLKSKKVDSPCKKHGNIPL